MDGLFALIIGVWIGYVVGKSGTSDSYDRRARMLSRCERCANSYHSGNGFLPECRLKPFDADPFARCEKECSFRFKEE